MWGREGGWRRRGGGAEVHVIHDVPTDSPHAHVSFRIIARVL